MEKIKWGIIGLGNIANNFAHAFNFCKYAQLIGISSKDKSKLDKFKNIFKIKNEFCFENYHDIVSLKEIDAIYIALPNTFHFKWIENCIKQNKKVLVEKPALNNIQESEKLQRMLQNQNYFLAEAFMYRFHPQIDVVINLIKNKEIGDLISMESNFGSDILTKKKFWVFKSKKKPDEKKRIFNKKLGGGAIMDLGCYTTSFSSLIAALKSKFDKFEVKNKTKEICSTGVDIDSYCEIHFDNNFVAKVGASFSKNIGRGTKIFGDKGCIIIDDTWFGSSEVTIKRNNNLEKIKINKIENIYSEEIDYISKNLIEKKKEIDITGISLNDIILNTKVLNNWLT